MQEIWKHLAQNELYHLDDTIPCEVGIEVGSMRENHDLAFRLGVPIKRKNVWPVYFLYNERYPDPYKGLRYKGLVSVNQITQWLRINGCTCTPGGHTES